MITVTKTEIFITSTFPYVTKFSTRHRIRKPYQLNDTKFAHTRLQISGCLAKTYVQKIEFIISIMAIVCKWEITILRLL